MELGFKNALAAVGYERQRFIQQREAFLNLPHFTQDLRQHGQMRAIARRCPGRPQCRYSLTHLGHPCGSLALLSPRPTMIDARHGAPEREPLFGCNRDRFSSECLSCLHIPSVIMECHRCAQGESQTEGMREFTGQRQRLVASLPGLIRVAQEP